MTDAQGAGIAPEEAAPTTRDWAWGVVVVVGGTVLVIGTLIWILASSSSCGTRPAPGYDDAGTATCGSLADPRRVAETAEGRVRQELRGTLEVAANGCFNLVSDGTRGSQSGPPVRSASTASACRTAT